MMHLPRVMQLVLLALAPAWRPALAAGRPTGLEADLEKGPSGKVARVVDRDTVILEDKVEVRLAGIQEPKLPPNRPDFKEWPLAGEANAELEKLVLGRQVTLSFGGARGDRHGRTLAYLHTDDGVWVQGEMLSRGFARVYTF